MGGVNDNGDSGVKTADINVIPKALRERNIVAWKLLNRVASNVTSLLTPYTFYSSPSLKTTGYQADCYDSLGIFAF